MITLSNLHIPSVLGSNNYRVRGLKDRLFVARKETDSNFHRSWDNDVPLGLALVEVRQLKSERSSYFELCDG
jgi:hypothetical protein